MMRGLIGGAAAVVAVAGIALLTTVIGADSEFGSLAGAKHGLSRSGLTPIPDSPPGSAPPIYWGAYVENRTTEVRAPWDMTPLYSFASLVGKEPSLVGFSSPFAECIRSRSRCTFYDFPTTPMEKVRRYGAIPFFSWGYESIGPKGGIDQPNFQFSDLLSGRYDAYIRKFASDARDWGQPFFLRFNWEMNGDWFPWTEQVNDNQPGDYVKAWRHVHDLFAEVGATNATWVWCPNVDPHRSLQELSLLYPGDSYVDWTCLDGYNWGTGSPVVPNSVFSNFAEIFDTTYRRIIGRIAPGKPMVLGEFATSAYGGDKAAWIRDALIRIPTLYPRIRGLIWFNINDRNAGWPIEGSPAAVDAFRREIASPVYVGNEFGTLTASPIEPLGRTE